MPRFLITAPIGLVTDLRPVLDRIHALFEGSSRHRSPTIGWVRETGIDLDHMRTSLAQRLTEIDGTWTVDNGVIRCDGSPVIVIKDLHHGTQHANHIDVGFALNPEHPDAQELWDCAVGYGSTPVEVAETAAWIWLEITGKTILELIVQRGDLATHISSNDPSGLPGYHVIHGPVPIAPTCGG